MAPHTPFTVSIDYSSASMMVCIINVVKTCIGSGILAFPWAFAYGSLWPSICVCLFSPCYNLICGMLIVHGCEATGVFGYAPLLKTVGKWAERVCGVVICYCVWSTCLVFCTMLPQFLQPAFADMFGLPRFSFDEEVIILVIALFVLYPLCLLKDLSSLRYSSAIGNLAIFYCLGLFLYEALAHHRKGREPGTASDDDAAVVFDHWSDGIFIVINVASKANSSHYALGQIYGSLERRSVKRMWVVMVVSYSVVTAIYLTFALCGYYLFGSDAQANVLNNFDHEAGGAVSVARVGTAISIIGCFPLIFKAGVNALEGQFFSVPGSRWNFEENPAVRVTVISAILAVLVTVSLFVDDIGPIVSVEGAITVLLLICTFPILIYWKIRFGGKTVDVRKELYDHLGISSYRRLDSYKTRRRAWSLKLALGVLFALGIGMGVSGFIMSLVIMCQSFNTCPL